MFWQTAKSGKVYAEYDKVDILQNPPGSTPEFEYLIPTHLDKDDPAKKVWNSPYGITYYLFEGNDSQWDDAQKKYVPKNGPDGKPLKKWLVYRTPTADYNPYTPAQGGGGNKQQFEIYATRVVEIGGSGYIGSALIQRLLGQGEQVVAVDSLVYDRHAMHGFFADANFTFVKADVRNITIRNVAGNDVDCVVNLAALTLPASEKAPGQAMEVNTDAAIKLGNECENSSIHYIYPSTCSNYGVKTDGYAVEEDELKPVSTYARTKVAAEHAFSPLRCVTILRFATAYGLGAMFRPDLLLHQFIIDALTKGPNQSLWTRILSPNLPRRRLGTGHHQGHWMADFRHIQHRLNGT